MTLHIIQEVKTAYLLQVPESAASLHAHCQWGNAGSMWVEHEERNAVASTSTKAGSNGTPSPVDADAVKSVAAAFKVGMVPGATVREINTQ